MTIEVILYIIAVALMVCALVSAAVGESLYGEARRGAGPQFYQAHRMLRGIIRLLVIAIIGILATDFALLIIEKYS